jgi:hypothetical protein
MPPPTVTCQICGQTVSKRQSFAYKEGRACKIHEEAQLKAEKREEKAKVEAEIKIKIEAQKCLRKEPGHFLKELEEFREWCDSHCWGCGKEGFGRQQYYGRVLIAMEKLSQQGETVVPGLCGDQQKLREAMNLNGMALAVFPMIHDDRKYRCFRQDVWDVARLLGEMVLCKECAGK